MKTKRLTQALERVEAWPAHAQDELAEIAPDIDESLGEYRADAGQGRRHRSRVARRRRGSLRDREPSRRGVRQAARRMKVVYTDAALHDLDEQA